MQRMSTLRASASRAVARLTVPTSSLHLPLAVTRCISSSLILPSSTISAANRSFSTSSTLDTNFFTATNKYGMSKAMIVYIILGGALTCGSLGYWLFLNHPQDHELAQQAAVVIERHKDLLNKLYAKPGDANTPAVPAPTNIRIGRMYDSDLDASVVPAEGAPQSSGTVKLYIFLPETNFGMGEIHIQGKKRSTPLVPLATGTAPATPNATSATTATPVDEKKKQGSLGGLTSFVSNIASSVTGARASLPTPAELNTPAGEIPVSTVPLEWELTDLVLSFPKSNKSFVYDTKKYRFVEQNHNAASPAPSHSIPFSVNQAVKVIKQSSSVDSWWKLTGLTTLTVVFGFSIYRWMKGADTRALNKEIINAITKNADIRARLAASSLTAKKTGTTYARKSITNTVAGMPSASKEDRSMFNNQYKVTGGGKSATVTVDAIQQTKKDKNGKVEVGWRIVGARIQMEGKRDQIVVKGLSL